MLMVGLLYPVINKTGERMEPRLTTKLKKHGNGGFW